MFSSFSEILENRHQHAKGLKAELNRPLIGYLCSYVPEELIYAAGAIPVRILTNEEPPIFAERYMQSYYCLFARNILHQGLQGDYDYLEGVVTAYTCTTMRLAFDNWQRSIHMPFYRFIHVPAIIDRPEAKEFLVRELGRLRKDLSDFTGRTITDDDLREAIRTYDTNRSFIMRLFEQRKEDPPLISGLEAFQVTLSSMLTDKQRHNEMLTELLDHVTDRTDTPDAMGRVMLVGSPVDNLKLVELIEGHDAVIVADDVCTGTRYVYGETPSGLEGDPIEAIANRYMWGRPPCPVKYSPTRWLQCVSCPYRAVCSFELTPEARDKPPESSTFAAPKNICRFRHMLHLAAGHKVEGVVVFSQKFCQPHGFDYHHVVQTFEDVGVPTLYLEEGNIVATGPMSTRVQAFIEMLGPVEYLIEPGILK
jgi:benzoyl-CoA reductase subunit C